MEMFKEYPDILSVKQVSQMLQIGIVLAYKLIQSGEIKSRKIGRDYKIQKKAVVAFLNGDT
ncbi:MAG: helix-turn-helix domain-containing protein [Firmicutes bacterium]|nr:helix-turn-helix domain-containing protein [Bacillota bacterium]